MNTNAFIKKFLKRNTHKKFSFDLIKEYNLSEELIAEYILSMKYYHWLTTAYWRQVRRLILERDGQRCTICGRKTQLRVHHLSYHLHGYEHTDEGLKQLTTLCNACHEHLHHLQKQTNTGKI